MRVDLLTGQKFGKLCGSATDGLVDKRGRASALVDLADADGSAQQRIERARHAQHEKLTRASKRRAGTIAGQDPDAGVYAPKGSQVLLYPSNGAKRR